MKAFHVTSAEDQHGKSKPATSTLLLFIEHATRTVLAASASPDSVIVATGVQAR